MKYIPLTKGYSTIVDDDDYEKLLKFKWQVTGDKTRYPRPVRTTSKEGKRRTVYLYREILMAGEGDVVDHVNHNTLDNRKCNLRLCGAAENSYNRYPGKNNTSGYKGVFVVKTKNKERVKLSWISQIKYKSKVTYLGIFDNPVSAAAVYDVAAKKMFGEFATTNSKTKKVV